MKKILKQVEYESAPRKRHINEKTRKRDEEGSTFILCTFIKGTRGNSRELKGSACRSNGRKKTQEKGKRGKISQIIEQEKRKHRSALRALKNCLDLGHFINSVTVDTNVNATISVT